MPTSKKPRRKFQPRRHARRVTFFTRDTIETIHDQFRRIEYAVLNRLHTGECTENELYETRDLLNGVLFGIMHRQKALDVAECNVAVDTLTAGGIALATVTRNGLERHRFICHADELHKIEEAVAVAGQFIEDSLDPAASAATMMVDEMNGSMLIRDCSRKCARIQVTKKIIDRAYNMAVDLSRWAKSPDFQKRYDRTITDLSGMIAACQ